jgi:uncharacterized membrane protein YqiK
LWFGFIRRLATAIGSGSKKEKRKSSLRTAAVIAGLVRDYKIDSINRIEDAVVEEVESEALAAKADAEFRVAEAAEQQARAALKRAEANLTQAKADAVAKESSVKAETARIKAIADAAAKLADAAAKLKRAGGSVIIIESEIVSLLQEGRKEFPADKLIADVQEQVKTPEPN